MAAMATERAQRMLDSLPSYYWEEPIVQRIVQAYANELDRLEAFLMVIQQGLNPALADDSYGMLALWEAELGMAIAPPDATVAQRAAKVRGHLASLIASSGLEWVAAMSEAIGASWSYSENDPAPQVLTIELAFDPGSYDAGVIEEFARAITDAHILIVFHYTVGFILDVARLDLNTL